MIDPMFDASFGSGTGPGSASGSGPRGSSGPGTVAGSGTGAGSGRSATRAVYVISVAAELAGVHPQTLRLYERKGLVDPSRTGGGSRRYSAEDIRRLHRISELTSAGLNLEGVRQVLALEEEVSRLRRELVEARCEAREAVDRAHKRYRRELVPVRSAAVVLHSARAPSPRR